MIPNTTLELLRNKTVKIVMRVNPDRPLTYVGELRDITDDRILIYSEKYGFSSLLLASCTEIMEAR